MAIVPDMQQRHFEFIASVIAGMEGCDGYRANIAEDFAKALRATNGRFNAAKFLAACARPK